MARDFSKNTSNHMSLGAASVSPLLHGSAAISLAAWVNIDSFTAATAFCNDVLALSFSTDTASAVLLFDTTSSVNGVKVFARAESSESGQTAKGTTSLSTGVWYHVGCVIDYANDRIRVYVNGSQEVNQAVSFTATSFTGATSGGTKPDGVGVDFAAGGSPTSTTRQMDGRIAEVGIWSSDIGDGNFAALADAISPSLIRPATLAVYMPLNGRNSPERDLVGGLSGTITGTIPYADHPRVIMPRRRKRPTSYTAATGNPWYYHAQQRAAA